MKKTFSVLLSLVLALSMLTACGGTESASTGKTDSEPASVSETEPLPPPEPEYDPAVLTGLPKDGDYPKDQRFVGVMINNISNDQHQNARPQSGISSADVLIEIKVEGGITRFCGLFTDYTKMPEVCPVRSARDQFFQLLVPFQPIYAHVGHSVVMPMFLDNFGYKELDLDFDNDYGDVGRVKDRPQVAYEHTAYIDADWMQKGIDRKHIDIHHSVNSTFFPFVNYNEPARTLSGPDAVKVKIKHSDSYLTYFDWDTASSKYMMSQYSRARGGVHETVDKNTNEQLGFENVLVLFAPFDVYPDPGNSGYDLQKVDYTLGGVGYYFNGGKAEEIHWSKGDAYQPLRFNVAGSDEEMQLNTGRTYLAVVDCDEAPEFSFDTGIEEAQSAAPAAE